MIATHRCWLLYHHEPHACHVARVGERARHPDSVSDGHVRIHMSAYHDPEVHRP